MIRIINRIFNTGRDPSQLLGKDKLDRTNNITNNHLDINNSNNTNLNYTGANISTNRIIILLVNLGT